jgi:hypothetical protein
VEDNMAGVYNRKLFRQASARDELRKLGGIMASSEELMMEALRTAAQAPRPSGLGSMPLPPQPAMPMQPPMGMPMQPMMQPPMDMGMQQPMGMQPAMPMQPMMQPPMDMGMQPQPQPMMPSPMDAQTMESPYMPPQLPQSAFAPGGAVVGAPNRATAYQMAQDDVRETEYAVDISKPAGSYVPSVTVSEKAVELVDKVDTQSPEDTADEVLTAAAEEGAELTGDKKFDLATIYERMTGDATAYEKNIDALNRGIIGAAIGAGTSARATENISKGLLVGLEGARNTEERRAGDARALQLAALQGLVKGTGGGGGTDMSPMEPFADAVREMALALIEDGSAESAEQATAMATAALAPLYQGTGAASQAGVETGGGVALTKVQQDALAIARQRLAAGTTTPEQVQKVFTSLGIPMEALNE